jgi:hypothetical protein
MVDYIKQPAARSVAELNKADLARSLGGQYVLGTFDPSGQKPRLRLHVMIGKRSGALYWRVLPAGLPPGVLRKVGVTWCTTCKYAIHAVQRRARLVPETLSADAFMWLQQFGSAVANTPTP